MVKPQSTIATMNLSFCLIAILLSKVVSSHILDRTVFVLMTQEAHEEIGEISYQELDKNLKEIGVKPNIVSLHKDLPSHGGWTIFPLLHPLLEEYEDLADWFVFLDEAGRVKPSLLTKVLQKYDQSHSIFLGKALQDRDSVIIHHYSQDYDFKYPDFSAGFVFSAQLAKSLSKELKAKNFDLEHFPKDFSIDAQYELAKVINTLPAKNSKDEKSSVVLNHEDAFCVKQSKDCATWKADVNCQTTQEEVYKLAEETLFAVKTCKKYHSERLPIIMETWSKAALNIEYFSEEVEEKFGTKVLPEVKKNTERGHCMKTEAILKFFNKNRESKGWKWLVIADDDTIMSVQKMLEFLKCYKPENPLAIGQRYGFRVAEGKYGYDYITGGGGMVFSHNMVHEMMKDDGAHCHCPRPDHPDDMHLAGVCIANLGLTIVHSDRFHQARPDDYSPNLLKDRDPISFHKFWNNDPLNVYKKYFKESDETLKTYKYNKLTRHQEL